VLAQALPITAERAAAEPGSTISLAPWSPPPARQVFDAVGASFWTNHQLLPLVEVETATGELLVVASARAEVPDAVVDELRLRCREPVRLVAAGSDQVSFWLEVFAAVRTWPSALAEREADLLASLDLYAHADGRARAPTDLTGDSLGVDQVQDAFGLTLDTALETLALAARLPQIRLERYALGAHLSPFLPAETAATLAVVPVVVHKGVVILASPRVYSAATLERLERDIGLEPRLCLCTPETFVAAIDRVYGSPPPTVSPPAEDALLAQLIQAGDLDAGFVERLRSVSDVTGEPVLAAARRLGYVNEVAILRARAARLNLPFIADTQPAVDTRFARLAAPALWRRWACVPIRHPGTGAMLAAVRPLSQTMLDAASRLLGAPTRQALLTASSLAAAYAALPPRQAEPYRTEHHLLETGLIDGTSDTLRPARRLAEQSGISIAAALHERGAITTEDLVEATAVAQQRSWIHLTRYAPEPAVARLVPLAVATESHAVAFRQHGPTVMVALLNGCEEPTAELLAQLEGRCVEPVLAVADDPDRMVERWTLREAAPLPAAYDEFGRYLLRHGRLSREQLDDLWDRVGQGARLEDALQVKGLMHANEVARTFAQYLNLGLADLDLREDTRDYIDALGRLQRDVTWTDPVTPAVARLLPRAVAERLRAVPMLRDDDAIVVAVVNPLDEAALAEIESTLAEPLILRVAEPRHVEVALVRVWRSSTVGERLLRAGLISHDDLQRALDLQDRSGVRIGTALLSLGVVTPDELAYCLAEQAGLPFFDLDGVSLDAEAAYRLPAPLYGERRFLPLYAESDGTVVIGTPDPLSREELDAASRLLNDVTVRQVVVTEPDFAAALDTIHREEFREHAASALLSRSPEDSARWVLSRGQKWFFIGLLVAIAVGAVVAPLLTALLFVGITTAFYFSFSIYKFYLAYRAIAHTLEIETTPEELAALDDRQLPVYTILVPLYREAEVLPRLVRAIAAMDYPKPKLDVKLLLEEDDTETIAVARASHLPSHFKIVVIPHGMPKGKPKACNYGLIYALGDYVVIFDAEDLPERDQLKKAIVAFGKGSDRLACVQGKLNYYNRHQNLLTRWFTTEYSMWFDLFLPGLDASGAPIPLGGTSNHFRTDVLRQLGAWDPYNVTEDADLGVRLYKDGWKTAVIDSTTYEEANSEVYNWIRQRSRWVKGYIQTYLVHMRDPVRLWGQLGPRGFFSFQLVVGGTFLSFLLNPVFWLLTALWFLFHWGWIRAIYPLPLFYMGAFSLYVGNFAFTYLNVAGCLRRGYYDMVKYALLSPVYWALMSVAAWKGFLQLFYAPSYWEKTKHGLYKGEVNIESASQMKDLL
jgi:cellulose synthase/poly-beta-1,6-N-acetylglucosamine synthase-like glycosyltransferase